MFELNTYREVEQFLFEGLLHYSQDGTKALQPGLGNTLRLLQSLGNPHHHIQTIHVAGTNGKGSVSHMFASALMANGQRVGLYTSPHLVDYRERIRIDGNMITESAIVKATQMLLPTIIQIHPSFFEVTVAIALWYFYQEQVDIAVIEVGLGGTYDSTNVITPILSVITNVAMDHQQTLGRSITEIASNKAGIIKPHVPVVLGRSDASYLSIITSEACAQQAPLHLADREIQTLSQHYEDRHLDIEYLVNRQKVHVHSSLVGHYQIANIRTVLCGIEVLRLQFPNLQNSFLEAISHMKDYTNLQGRWQTWQTSPKVILDVAHNEDGMKEMSSNLDREQYDNLYIIMGASADKDVQTMMTLLPLDAVYIFTKSDNRRAISPDELITLSPTNFRGKHTKANIREAYASAIQSANRNDLILIIGSCFLIGDFLAWQHETNHG